MQVNVLELLECFTVDMVSGVFHAVQRSRSGV